MTTSKMCGTASPVPLKTVKKGTFQQRYRDISKMIISLAESRGLPAISFIIFKEKTDITATCSTIATNNMLTIFLRKISAFMHNLQFYAYPRGIFIMISYSLSPAPSMTELIQQLRVTILNDNSIISNYNILIYIRKIKPIFLINCG